MKKLELVLIPVVLVIVAGIAYGSFHLYRWFNWSFGYETKVIETIKTKVKPECLK